MNREIIFRAKTVPSGFWVYGDLEYSPKKLFCRIHAYKDDGSYFRQFDVDPNTIGQFTGLKDKNGQPVYEGDVVCKRDLTFGLKWLGFVVYNEQIGCFRIHNEIQGVTVDTGFENSDTYNDGKCTVECKYEYEVLGNIFDNKELLNNGQK